MAEAEVGDDVFGEDPTVRRLEALGADRLEKEAALLVTSGTQGNLAALLVHCGRGDEVILGDESHTFVYEAGGSSAVGGIHPHPISTGPDGALALDLLEAAVRADNIHFPRSRLICLENSHNRRGGAVLDPEYMKCVRQIADRHRLAIHVDGARLFNAAVAQGLPAAALVKHADTVSICLSKGLCAPVGSLLCGSSDFIAEARRVRKLLGGGMRQAGVLAAAGIVALSTMVDRLADDHRRAQWLAQELATMPGVRICPEDVRTNIVIFEVHGADLSPSDLTARAAEQGLLFFPVGGMRLRLVTHHDVDDEQIEAAASILRSILASAKVDCARS